MRRLNSQFKTRFISEPGADGKNSTYYGFVEMDQYFCMAVAEGYDGEGGKDSAKLAVDTVIEAFVQKPGMKSYKLKACLSKANKVLKEQSIRFKLKAGILLMVSDYTRFKYAVCGNVMVYAMRNNTVYHQSLTHTVYQSMREENPEKESVNMTPEETRNLYHYLGGDGHCTVSGKIKLNDGDMLLTATESFWSRVTRVEVLDAFESLKSQEEFLGDLQELYLKGTTEYIPSCCLAAVQIEKAYKENTRLKKKILLWILILTLILAVAGTVFFFYTKKKNRKQEEIRNTADVYEDNGDRYMEAVNSLLAKQEYEKAIETGKKLSKNDERLDREQTLTHKINIGTVIDSAEKAYAAREFTQARSEYKKALEYLKEQPDLSALVDYINQRLKLLSSRMEIDNYMESGALKEAEGDLEAAGILYSRAEAMLRIVDDPELLKQAQLAKLRIKDQSEQEDKDEQAKKRDAVIIDADKTAAMDAVLAGDYEAAIELYTKIRDSYIAIGENDKAEDTTEILVTLQKQARAALAMDEAAIEENKAQALLAALDGDIKTALSLYEKIKFTYLAMREEEKAEEIQALMDSLKNLETAEGSESKDQTGEKIGPGETKAPETGAQPKKEMEKETKANDQKEPEGSEEDIIKALEERAAKAEASQDYETAIKLYKQLRQLYKNKGDTAMVGQAEEKISQLSAALQEGLAAGPGGV